MIEGRQAGAGDQRRHRIHRFRCGRPTGRGPHGPEGGPDTAQVMRAPPSWHLAPIPSVPGRSGGEDVERYGLTVGRPMPDVLTKLKTGRHEPGPAAEHDPPARGRPNRRSMAPSLVEFLRNAGGLLPVGELLDATGQDSPGKKSLIQDSGLSLDEAAMKAVKRDSSPARRTANSETQLVEAITREVLGGSPSSPRPCRIRRPWKPRAPGGTGRRAGPGRGGRSEGHGQPDGPGTADAVLAGTGVGTARNKQMAIPAKG